MQVVGDPPAVGDYLTTRLWNEARRPVQERRYLMSASALVRGERFSRERH